MHGVELYWTVYPIREGKVLNQMSGDLSAGSDSFPETTRDSIIRAFNSLVSKELPDVPKTP